FSRRPSMSVPEPVQPAQLLRLAVVYVRQSSPHQAFTNQESLKLQYNLQDRAQAAGWDPSQIRVIDADLGRSGRTSHGRPRFHDPAPRPTQDEGGIIFA